MYYKLYTRKYKYTILKKPKITNTNCIVGKSHTDMVPGT